MQPGDDIGAEDNLTKVRNHACKFAGERQKQGIDLGSDSFQAVLVFFQNIAQQNYN